MITFNALEGVEYTHDGYEGFIDSCHNEYGWEIENLGVSSDVTKNVYGMKMGDFSKPTIFLVSGVHGNEWQAVYGVQRFRQLLINPPDGQKNIFNKLANNYSWYVIPLANPYGFEKKLVESDIWTNQDDYVGRYNYNDRDISRDFLTQTQPENIIIASKILELMPLTVIDCHGYGGEYFDYGRSGENFGILPEQIRRSASLVMGRDVPYYDTPREGILRSWSSLQDSKHGRKTLGFLIENRWSSDPKITSFSCLNILLTICVCTTLSFELNLQNPSGFVY